MSNSKNREYLCSKCGKIKNTYPVGYYGNDIYVCPLCENIETYNKIKIPLTERFEKAIKDSFYKDRYYDRLEYDIMENLLNLFEKYKDRDRTELISLLVTLENFNKE